ncbi:hypothetical protein, partial [Pumilibacter muris]|uniref:hypothetical protein n=1 Tax=Pumilibacter muris TaxID=2941510 RepID=UPI00203C11C9
MTENETNHLPPHSRCHCERVKRARQSPPQKPLQKPASQNSYCASTAVVITSAAIFAQKVPPTKKQKEKKKARLKGSMLSSGALYIHINGN